MTNSGLKPNTASRLKNLPPLMRGQLSLHKNIPVSDYKLTRGLRVGIINSHLASDKLFQTNLRALTGPPKMSLPLEVSSRHELIMKPRLILVEHSDVVCWYITSNQ